MWRPPSAPVAQLDRAPDYESGGQRFESFRARHFRSMLGTGRVIESFVVESWLEHERQHARVTKADRIDQETLNAFQIGEGPVVRHVLRPG